MRRFLLLVMLSVACAGTPSHTDTDGEDISTPDAGSAPDAGLSPDAGTPEAVKQRPYDLHVPGSLDASKPAPLVILLHGYSANALGQEAYFQLTRASDAHGFLYAMPQGTIDRNGNRFWNATDSCCDFFATGVDDVGYVNALIDDVSRRFQVDPKRVYLVGHSNGGFLSHRVACDLSPRIAAIVSLAGAQWLDVSHCRPSEPVSVLEVHGDADEVIHYGGGHPSDSALIPLHPGAVQTVADWASLNGCDASPTEDPQKLDVDALLSGAETVVTRHAHCRGGAAELWTIRGGRHIPNLTGGWAEQVWGFLAAHPKP